MIRATWYTSLLAGIIVGELAALANPPAQPPWGLLLLLAFFPLVFVGVIGLPQHQKIRAEMKKRGYGYLYWQIHAGDFRQYIYPLWGRGFIWFAAVVATLVVGGRLDV